MNELHGFDHFKALFMSLFFMKNIDFAENFAPALAELFVNLNICLKKRCTFSNHIDPNTEGTRVKKEDTEGENESIISIRIEKYIQVLRNDNKCKEAASTSASNNGNDSDWRKCGGTEYAQLLIEIECANQVK